MGIPDGIGTPDHCRLHGRICVEFGNEFLSTILKAKFIKENNFKGEVKMAE